MGNIIELFDPFSVDSKQVLDKASDTIADVFKYKRCEEFIQDEQKHPKRNGTISKQQFTANNDSAIVTIRHACNVTDVCENTKVQEIHIIQHADGGQEIEITYWQQPLLNVTDAKPNATENRRKK